MKREKALDELNQRIQNCRVCPRLVEHRETVARTKRRAYREWDYWGQPVPSFGHSEARLLIVGLAPAAHGANRTGRMFTGDSSGDLLYATLCKYGLSSQSHSSDVQDGLSLNETYITAALHCVPPQNRPLKSEILNCRRHLTEELALLKEVRVVVALGAIAWRAYLDSWQELGRSLPSPLPRFAHGAASTLDKTTVLLGSYHPSRQNTQTGRLTTEMFETIFQRAAQQCR